jgi:hypothetical protein
MDLNGNGDADSGELFGAGMPLPTGGFARNGFQALAVYDASAYGGDGDGLITRADAVWDRLRLWVDANHDGRSDPRELSTPGANHIDNFDLAAVSMHRAYSNGNTLMFSSWYRAALHAPGAAPFSARRRLVDVSFIPAQP